MATRLSKSRFVAGVQCLKRLYFQVHRAELAAPAEDAVEAIMRQGNEVGAIARRAFPGGVMVEGSHEDLSSAVRTTRELIANDSVPAVFEATFASDDILVRVDVLERTAPAGFRVIEVKSATSVKDYYRYDVGIQRHVVEKAGIPLCGTYVMHLNRQYAYGGGDYDLSQLFTQSDLSTDAVPDAKIRELMKEQFTILGQPEPPQVKPGDQCTNPVTCEFFEHCNPEVPPNHVNYMPGLRSGKIDQLAAMAVTTIDQIPDDFPLSDRQRRVRECVKSGSRWIAPEVGPALASVKYPLCFMDFETVNPALPWFVGMRPYDPIPFQWSLHRQETSGAPLKHFEFLAKTRDDPRRDFAESLLQATAGAGTVVVYNKAFEAARLDDLAGWMPDHAQALEALDAKLWDLLQVVREHVYDPKFAGSYSLKQVLPALVPEMSYASLEVSNGEQAGLAWMQLLRAGDPAVSAALRAYCGQDTLALVRVLEVLRSCAPHA